MIVQILPISWNEVVEVCVAQKFRGSFFQDHGAHNQKPKWPWYTVSKTKMAFVTTVKDQNGIQKYIIDKKYIIDQMLFHFLTCLHGVTP